MILIFIFLMMFVFLMFADFAVFILVLVFIFVVGGFVSASCGTTPNNGYLAGGLGIAANRWSARLNRRF